MDECFQSPKINVLHQTTLTSEKTNRNNDQEYLLNEYNDITKIFNDEPEMPAQNLETVEHTTSINIQQSLDEITNELVSEQKSTYETISNSSSRTPSVVEIDTQVAPNSLTDEPNKYIQQFLQRVPRKYRKILVSDSSKLIFNLCIYKYNKKLLKENNQNEQYEYRELYVDEYPNWATSLQILADDICENTGHIQCLCKEKYNRKDNKRKLEEVDDTFSTSNRKHLSYTAFKERNKVYFIFVNVTVFHYI